MSPVVVPLIYVLAFVAVVMLVQGLSGLVFARRDRDQRVNRRLTMLGAGMSRDEVYRNLVRKPVGPAVGSGRLLDLHERVETYCRQAGVSLAPLHLLAIAGGGAAALWLISLSLASSKEGPEFLVNGAISMVGACAVSFLAVFLWVRRLRVRRLKQIEEQLPLALDIVNRAVRAGHPVVSAVQLASDELGDPIGSEFGLIVDETTYGMDFKDALASFARRTGSPDAHFFAVSVSIQSETGGNLAEILEGLAKVMRGRNTLGKRVRALASEGRASAILLSVLPILMVAFQLLTNPRYYSTKFSDPIFWPTVTITGVIYLSGWLMVQRIINFKY
ncbi:MAG: type II secretion system F family protein [Phenylobacterium sp.]